MVKIERTYWGIATQPGHRDGFYIKLQGKSTWTGNMVWSKAISRSSSNGFGHSDAPLLFYTRADALEACGTDETPIKLKITIEEA